LERRGCYYVTPGPKSRDAGVRKVAKDPAKIHRRLRELDEEWDIERVLETNASALAFVGAALGASVDRRWLLIPIVVGGFLFQHAIQGWCPPIPVLRRLGFRTAREIEIERVALKALRGDFRVAEAVEEDAQARANFALSAARLSKRIAARARLNTIGASL
jgi:hypothetical protein